jgi:hypothetical protein
MENKNEVAGMPSLAQRLREPFPESDIEWRIQSSGKKGDRYWAKVLAYVQARAIQERLDEVFTIFGWQDHYKFIHYSTVDSKEYSSDPEKVVCDGVLCVLGVKPPPILMIPAPDKNGLINPEEIQIVNPPDPEWIEKSDGAPFTNFESFKGGISDAFKRVAASGYGIGRYLYKLEIGWAEVFEDTKKGKYYSKIEGKPVSWNPPKLPAWALPGGSGRPDGSDKLETKISDATEGPIEDEVIDPMDKRIILSLAEQISEGAKKKVNDYITTGSIRRSNINTFMHDTFNTLKKTNKQVRLTVPQTKRLKDTFEIEV